MRKLLLDTNVLLDIAIPSRPEHKSAGQLVRLARESDCEVAVLASSLKDVYYIFERRYGSEANARKAVRLLRRMALLYALDSDVVDMAFASDEPDFEDGLVRAAAERNHVDAIISRDAAAFSGSCIPRLSIDEAIGMLDA